MMLNDLLLLKHTIRWLNVHGSKALLGWWKARYDRPAAFSFSMYLYSVFSGRVWWAEARGPRVGEVNSRAYF
jgi:hypothetical protein